MTVNVTGINLSTGAPYSAAAAGNGSTDDTAVLQAAITACGLIKLPAGTYRTTATLTFPLSSGNVVAGSGILGAGSGSTTIFADHTATAIQANSGVTGQCLNHRGYTLTRGGTPAANTFGLDMGLGSTPGNDTPDKCRLDDLILDGHYTGLRASTTGWSRMTNIISRNNLLDGVYLATQWQTKNIQSTGNGRYGFYFTNAVAAGNSVGNYRSLTASGNASHGFYATGKVFALRLIACVSNNNGGDGFYIDTSNSGVVNSFTSCSASGNSGLIGWYFGVESGHNSLWQCSGIGSTYGLYSDANSAHGLGGSLSVNGGSWNNNSGYGILVAIGKATIYGATASGNGTGIGAGASVTDITVAYCDASGSTTPFDLASASGLTRYNNNPSP